MSFQELLSAPELGQQVIALALSIDTPKPLEGVPFVVTCDYSQAEPNGIVLPVVVQFIAPDGRKIVERELSRVLPESIDFVADVGGKHLVRIAEINHNRWFGALVVDVDGDTQRQD